MSTINPNDVTPETTEAALDTVLARLTGVKQVILGFKPYVLIELNDVTGTLEWGGGINQEEAIALLTDVASQVFVPITPDTSEEAE